MNGKIFAIGVTSQAPYEGRDKGWLVVDIHWLDENGKHHTGVSNVHPDNMPRIMQAQRALINRQPIDYQDKEYTR